MKIKILLASLLIGNIAFASNCNCDNSVTNNYEQIKTKVPERFVPVEKKLDNTIVELDKTIAEKQKELELLKSTIQSKQALLLQHSSEIAQLQQMNEYIKNQNDAKAISAKTEVAKTQNSITDKMLNTEENSRESFWKK